MNYTYIWLKVPFEKKKKKERTKQKEEQIN